MRRRTSYGLQGHVYRHSRVARPLPGGRPLQSLRQRRTKINDETLTQVRQGYCRPRHNPAYSPAVFLFLFLFLIFTFTFTFAKAGIVRQFLVKGVARFASGFSAQSILTSGFDETNLIDLNWYVLAGIIGGCGFTYLTFALRKWRYKTMTAIAFALAIVYLGYFYFMIDYGVEKEMLFIPLFFRGASTVIISIVFLTSIVQSGLPFQVFPQALTINGFTGAVMGATLGPALIGEFLSRTLAKNAALLGAALTDFNPASAHLPPGEMYGLVQVQALVVSMKEIYGWLLIASIVSLSVILVSYSPMRPWAIFPKWKTIRRTLRHLVRQEEREQELA